MPIQLQLGSLAARPLFYNRVLQSLQECPDSVLERISFLTRYLYAQHLKKYHQRKNAGLSLYQVPGGIYAPPPGEGGLPGMSNIGLVKNTQRRIGYNPSSKVDDIKAPPGADLRGFDATTTEYPTQHSLYQFTTLGTLRPTDTTLNESGYMIYDSEFTYGKGIRVSGGTAGSELDIIHTIIRDVLKNIELGDMLASYYIADISGSEVLNGVPIEAGGEAGSWLDCGEYMSDTLFDPIFAVTVEQSPYKNMFAQIARPYHIFLKHSLDYESTVWPTSLVKGLLKYSTDSSLSSDNGLQEFDADFDTSTVGYSIGVSDTLDNAPALYKDILLPILYRQYPRYKIGNTVSDNNHKGVVQDFVFLNTARDTILNPDTSVYTAIAEPKFVDESGNYLDNRDSWRYPNSGGIYYFNTDINYI